MGGLMMRQISIKDLGGDHRGRRPFLDCLELEPGEHAVGYPQLVARGPSRRRLSTQPGPIIRDGPLDTPYLHWKATRELTTCPFRKDEPRCSRP
jgi:hypothetical protein